MDRQKKWSLLPEAESYSWFSRFKLAYETDARKLINADRNDHQAKPILVASVGSLSGLLNSQPSNEVIYYYHVDHLGTPIMMTDNDQNIVWVGEFMPFGEQLSITETVTNNLRFPGQYYDEETGLHYNWHRDYKSEVGRYIEKDSILQLTNSNAIPSGCAKPTITWIVPSLISTPSDLHPYIYVQNNPVNRRDPYGLTSDKGKGDCIDNCHRQLPIDQAKCALDYCKGSLEWSVCMEKARRDRQICVAKCVDDIYKNL